jgi:hypothetical protein
MGVCSGASFLCAARSRGFERVKGW